MEDGVNGDGNGEGDERDKRRRLYTYNLCVLGDHVVNEAVFRNRNVA